MIRLAVALQPLEPRLEADPVRAVPARELLPHALGDVLEAYRALVVPAAAGDGSRDGAAPPHAPSPPPSPGHALCDEDADEAPDADADAGAFAAAAAHCPFGDTTAFTPAALGREDADPDALAPVAPRALPRFRSAAVGHSTPCALAAFRSLVTMTSRRATSGDPNGSPPIDGRKSPSSVAVTASISGDGPMGTCTGNAEMSLRG